MEKKKKGNKRKKLTLLILIILIIGLVSYVTYRYLTRPKEVEPETPEVTLLDQIEGYGYTLEDRDTDLYKEIFHNLEEEITKDKIDYKKYAEFISELYIIDLYTLDNKNNQYDLGGTEFVHPDYVENFSLKLKDTLYKYLEDNTNNKRVQKLPVVKTINVNNIEETDFKIENKSNKSYSVSLEWEYEEDMGYDSSCIITLIKVDNKLYIVEQK